MGIYTNTRSAFPSQVVSEQEKSSLEYGKQVAQAIEGEWFNQGRTNGNRYLTNWNNFNQLRLYARGEQSVQKYKDELSINGDLSYLNLDWTPVPILSKFVDIVVNGISQKQFEIKGFGLSVGTRLARLGAKPYMFVPPLLAQHGSTGGCRKSLKTNVCFLTLFDKKGAPGAFPEGASKPNMLRIYWKNTCF